MTDIVPRREIMKPINVRSSEFGSHYQAAASRGAANVYTLDLASRAANLRKRAILVGAKMDVSLAVSGRLRAATEHVLFQPIADDAGWQRELQAKLESVFNRSWQVQDVSIYVIREGFTPEQFTAILSGLQFVPRAIYLVNAAGPEGATVRELQRPKFDRLQSMLKRGVDIAGGYGLLLFLAPLMLLIGLLIKLDSRGPVFFRQRRLGFLGRPFDIYKFRTMTVQENGDTVVQACRHDPRVTRIGAFLRRSSLDELPQLLNVVKGDMSLVGPRPHAEAHDRQYCATVPRYTFRRYVKPGMTGWAQVHGYRGQITSIDDIMQRVEFDSWYARNATVFLDIQILFRTIAIVLNQKNAY